jgi:putative solute:sodium symporter small subunit
LSHSKAEKAEKGRSMLGMPDDSPRVAYIWRRNLRWILLLLSVWAALTFLPAWFARDVPYTVLGWPLSYWTAAYGAPLAYLLIVVVYARVMNRGDDATDE